MELLVAHLGVFREQSATTAASSESARRKGAERRIFVFSDVVPVLDRVAFAHVLVQAALEAAAQDRADQNNQQKSA